MSFVLQLEALRMVRPVSAGLSRGKETGFSEARKLAARMSRTGIRR